MRPMASVVSRERGPAPADLLFVDAGSSRPVLFGRERWPRGPDICCGRYRRSRPHAPSACVVEPRSFTCPDRGCGLVFDDPPLRCACGRGILRAFPRMRRPWVAQCDSIDCGRSYPTTLGVAGLTERSGVRLDFRPCRLGCRETHGPGPSPRRFLIIPVDIESTARLVALFNRDRRRAPRFRVGRAVDFHDTEWDHAPLRLGMLRTGTAPLWAGDWDAVIISGRVDGAGIDDVAFGSRQIMLPRDVMGWGDPPRAAARGRIGQLLLTPRADPRLVPLGRREMPRLAAIVGSRGSVTVDGLPWLCLGCDTASLAGFFGGLRPR